MDGLNGIAPSDDPEELILDAPTEEDAEDEFAVSFEDETDDPLVEEADEDEGAEDAPLRKKLRGIVRETSAKLSQSEKEKRELARELEEYRRQQVPVVTDPGPEPVYEGNEELYDYDPDKCIAAWKDWHGKQAEAERAKEAVKAEQEKLQQRGQEIVSRYETRAKALPVKDFDNAQEIVQAAIGKQRWGYIVAGAEEPEKLIYALSKNPKRLEALAAIDIDAKFAFAASRLEKEMKVVSRKKAPEPDVIVRGSGTLSNATSAKQKEKDKIYDLMAKGGDVTKLRERLRQLN
jgi:hypothetical protein